MPWSFAHAADETDGCGSVLVAHFVVWEIAEALLAAADVFALAFEFSDAIGNPFEAGVLVEAVNAVLCCDACDEFGGDDGFDHEICRLQLSESLLVLDGVPIEHTCCLVAVENLPFALVVAAYDGKAVSIGVGGDDKVGIELSAELHAECHSL